MKVLTPMKPEYGHTSGAWLRRWRTALHLSYEVVADTMGVDPITVRNWEKKGQLKKYIRLAFEKAFVDPYRNGPHGGVRLPGGSQTSLENLTGHGK